MSLCRQMVWILIIWIQANRSLNEADLCPGHWQYGSVSNWFFTQPGIKPSRIFIKSKPFTDYNSGLHLGLHQGNLHGFGKYCIYHMSHEVFPEILMPVVCRRNNTILQASAAEKIKSCNKIFISDKKKRIGFSLRNECTWEWKEGKGGFGGWILGFFFVDILTFFFSKMYLDVKLYSKI